ncbi:MAG: hypothetical protein LAN61_10610 [Acidobacteriia bacterium]|nr:hypothetical protein [Terriglobia bacterium]
MTLSYLAIYSFSLQRNARALLRDMRTITVGKSTGEEAVQIARKWRGMIYIEKETAGASSLENPAHYEEAPLSNCIADDCNLTLYVQNKWSQWHFSYLDQRPMLRRWLPLKGMVASLKVRKGIVTEEYVTLGLEEEELSYEADTQISSDPSIRSTWNITHHTAHNSGRSGGTRMTDHIRVQATPLATPEQLAMALDFDLRCMRLGVHCTECQLLPKICEYEKHGDWYYFTMPPDLFVAFQKAVNSLPLGITSKALHTRIGDENPFRNSAARIDDGSRHRGGILPFDFPDSTVFADLEPARLTYYLKKWREIRQEPLRDRRVTFVFDKNDRLAQIESHAEGIPSRP